MKLQRSVFEHLYSRNLPYGRKISLVESFILLLIILNVVGIILESFPNIHSKYALFLYQFEVTSVILFSLEYLLRVWVAPLRFPELTPWQARIKFATSAYGIIDLLSIVPFYLPYLITLDGRILRILRLLRIVRIFKLNRYSRSMRLVGSVFKEVKNDLLVTLAMCLILLLVSSAIMYHIEHEAQPDRFVTIFDAFWWAVATLTTVGYGDIFPITGWGKFVSGIIAILGIGLIALPAGILSSAFILKLNERKQEANSTEPITCPHCGKSISDLGQVSTHQ